MLARSTAITLHCRTRPPRQDDVGCLHEQRTQVFVATLGDLAQDRAIPGRLLLRHEAEPGTEVASLLKTGAIANRRDDGTRDDWSDPWYRHQALTGSVLLRQRRNLG